MYVSNLGHYITDELLEATFAIYGAVRSTQVMTSGFTGFSSGFGYAEMPEVGSRSGHLRLNDNIIDLKVIGGAMATLKIEHQGLYRIGKAKKETFYQAKNKQKQMNIEDIEGFLDKKTTPQENYVKISFKKRDTVYGLFIKDKDYAHLKSKNFWRIVTRTHFDEYNKSKNAGLAKIFSGSEFSRLSIFKETAEV